MSSFVLKKQLDLELFNKYIANAQSSNQFSNYGKAVQLLEQRARSLLKVDASKAIIATSSGASALQAIVYSIQRTIQINSIYSQDFTFPCSFQGSCSGAIPLDLDINQQIDLSEATRENSLLIVTNCFGHLQNIEHILAHARKYKQYVVFDNAATPYSFINKQNSCNLGLASFISLHHTKPIGFGEGGLVIIDKQYEHVVRAACNFGITDGKASMFGSNFKMSEVSAASILQWWDQFNIDSLAKQFRNNYWKKAKRYSNMSNNLFSNLSDANNFFPNCLPLVHDMEIDRISYPNEDARKYYKPFYELQNSKNLYKQIICIPITDE